MRCLLAEFCGFALISLSVAVSNTLMITQTPRFHRRRTNQNMTIWCYSKQRITKNVEWYKTPNFDGAEVNMTSVTAGDRIWIDNGSRTKSSIFFIELTKEDSGVYFCKINKILGPGSELEVVTHTNTMDTNRSNMKDGFIIFQGMLLAMVIAALLLRNQKSDEKKDTDYDEPEIDHIYEGLAIEAGGGDLYEDLSAYTQAEETEAPWE